MDPSQEPLWNPVFTKNALQILSRQVFAQLQFHTSSRRWQPFHFDHALVCSDVSGAHHALDVQPYLVELLFFLQQQVLQVKAVTHSCSWILVVFADQDDDLMESAKVLITLYLHQKR